jgi:hypothetical protein
VTVFAPSKAAYREQVERLERGGVHTIGKEHFTSLFSPVRKKAFTHKTSELVLLQVVWVLRVVVRAQQGAGGGAGDVSATLATANSQVSTHLDRKYRVSKELRKVLTRRPR